MQAVRGHAFTIITCTLTLVCLFWYILHLEQLRLTYRVVSVDYRSTMPLSAAAVTGATAPTFRLAATALPTSSSAAPHEA
jgi:hypothetical protein